MGKLVEQVFNRQSSIINRQSATPAAAIAFAFSAGIALSLICRAYCYSGLVAGNLALACASFLAWRKNRLTQSLTIALAAILVCGLLLGIAHRDSYDQSDLRSLIPQQLFPLNEPVSFEGCVAEDSQRRGDESVCNIELCAFLRKDQWIACEGKGNLRIASPAGEESTLQTVNLVRGDRIRGWAVWHTPRNFENPGSMNRAKLLARRGIYILGRTKSPRLLEKIPGGCSNPWSSIASRINARVYSSLEPIRAKGQSAAILASLLIGNYSGLDNNTREVFQNSGTYHVLVVSGLHVAWISGVLLQLFKLILLPDRIRYLLIAFVILLYTCVVGFQASITRCLWMFILYLIGRVIFRRADPANILLASALILLMAQPDWLFDSGFQLSFLSVMAIALTAVPAITKYLRPVWEPLMNSGKMERLFLQPGRWPRLGRTLRTECEMLVEGMTDSLPPIVSRTLFGICRGIGGSGLALGSMILTSIAVQIWIEPLLALNFNRMSWISPLANLIVVPLSSIVLASGIALLIVSGLPFIGQACLSLTDSLASFLLHVAALVADIPGAWQRCPTPSPACVLAGILMLFAWSFFKWRRFWVPCIYIAVLLLCLSRGSVPVLGALCEKWRQAAGVEQSDYWPQSASVLRFTFLDVGEGDSVVTRFPDGRIWVLDAGGLRLPPGHDENAYTFDVGEAVVSRYLWQQWITRLDRMILSHTDQDHAGGIPALLKNFQVSRFGYARAGSDTILEKILSLARERHSTARPLHSRMEERIGPVRIRIYHPPADSELKSANENSVVLQFSFRDFSALLTGDLEKAGELDLLSQSEVVPSQLLKVAHHGSRAGTSHAFLERVQPRWAVVSVGRNNPFGHPSRETMARIRQHGAQSFLTLDEGAITFETDGNRYAIKSHVRGILERGSLSHELH